MNTHAFCTLDNSFSRFSLLYRQHASTHLNSTGALGNCLLKLGWAAWSCYKCFACSSCRDAVWDLVVDGVQDCCVCYSKYVRNVCSYC